MPWFSFWYNSPTLVFSLGDNLLIANPAERIPIRSSGKYIELHNYTKNVFNNMWQYKKKKFLSRDVTMGFPGGASGKKPTCQCRRHK